MRPKITEETWTYIDRFFQEWPEAIEHLPSLQNSIQAAAREAVSGMMQAALHDAVQKGVTIGEQCSWHHALLRILEYKFNELPPDMARQIVKITDVEQFDRCLNQALTATALMNFPG